MPSPRIPLSWIILIAVIIVFGFFGYQIFQAAIKSDGVSPYTNEKSIQMERILRETPPPMNEYEHRATDAHVTHSMEASHDSVVEMPSVPGQTERDLRATRQVMETPPDVAYATPVSQDPLEGDVHSSSEFGDNLRHPEQMIEVHPPMGSMRMIQSGVASDKSFQGINNAIPYSPEMAQNGGEFMDGIMAFEDEGAAYATL
jgi:hypothetical protein